MRFARTIAGCCGMLGTLVIADRGIGSRPATACPEAWSLCAMAADTTIVVRASSSTLEYQPSQISVKNGARLHIRFINDGTLPHNIVVPRSEDDIDDLALAAYQAAPTGYVPVEKKDRMLAYSTLASPGETVEITFVVPPPGQYRYVCLFPGHVNSMLGTLRSLH